MSLVSLSVDGSPQEAEDGTLILDLLNAMGIHLPQLCHDSRLVPRGLCRLCLVELDAEARPVPACTTPVELGMSIRTRTPSLEAMRRTVLRELAWRYPADAVRANPEKPLHMALREYDLLDDLRGVREPGLLDDSHPYIRIDLSQCIQCFRCVRICDELQGQFTWRVLNRGERTRVAPDAGRALRESSCVSCGACADTCPTGAIEDRTLLAGELPERWTRTTCPYCGVGCEMDVGTRGNDIVTIRPARDAPVNKGHLCSKGRYSFGFLRARDRAAAPMVREGSSWREVSWPEAIHRVADHLKQLLARHGPSCVGVLGSARATNEENYIAQKFARVVLGTNNVDCCARVCHAPSAFALKAMLGTGASTNSFDDIERASAILVCGANATESHPVVGARIKQAALRGARLVVIDSRRIELADYAEVHLQPRPGTDVPLLNAIAATVVAEELVDHAFISACVDGFDGFCDSIKAWTPERAAELCGVDAESIRQAARIYAGTRPAMALHGLGITEHVQGSETVMCLVNLALLTGNLGKPGAGVNPLRGQNNVQGSAHMGCEPAHLTGYAPIERARATFEQAWSAELPTAPGLNLMQMLEAARSKKLHALWAIGYDVFLTNPEVHATREALRSLEMVIVQDIFLNETAREFGTLFLPAAASFEKEGTFMNAERRVQMVRKAVEAPTGARTDWAIMCDVAAAMGHPEGFQFTSAEEIWNEVRSVWPAGAGLSYDRLRRRGLQWPCPTEAHPGTQILHVDGFANASRAQLRKIDFRPSPERVNAEFPFLLMTGRSLHQFNAGTMTGRTPSRQLHPYDLLAMSPADAARLGMANGERVRIRSRYGETTLRLSIDDRLSQGHLFSTFQTADAFLNRVTSGHRDSSTDTPEYKVTAVQVIKAPADAPH